MLMQVGGARGEEAAEVAWSGVQLWESSDTGSSIIRLCTFHGTGQKAAHSLWLKLPLFYFPLDIIKSKEEEKTWEGWRSHVYIVCVYL